MKTTQVFYDIPAGPLIEKYAGKNIEFLTPEEKTAAIDKAAGELVERVKTGEIWFPFQKYFRGTPAILFANLKTIDLPVVREPYRLRSYYPQYGSYLPPKFRGFPTIIAGTRNTYDTADVLSDHFIEDVRLKAKRYDQIQSILSCWTSTFCLKEFMKVALNKNRVSPQTLRDSIYESTPETKIFNPTWARALIKLVMGPDVAGKKWLDISAGWGDRLLAAMSLNMDYTGYDPNIELNPGHSAMIAMFGDAKRHRVIYEPFEKAIVPGGPYDVVLTSPPYYTVEEYNVGQEGQSIVSYPEFNQWMVWFLFTALSNAWSNLKEGGYLILHLGDSKTIHTSEPANIYIENFLPGSSWEGVIGLQGEAGFARPVWVWKKLAPTSPRTVWDPLGGTDYVPGQKQRGPIGYANRTLYNTYPELQAELSNFYGAKYAPNYSIRKTNAVAIRDHVALANREIPREAIDKILSDDLMISSLLEAIGIEKTIIWGTAMIKLAFPR
ncbi:Hypothetical protein HVR_LOCUS726 [uncultured virus]|nr:Hypothetical protein HVR_LOCUS726 [uncultured virus]